MSFIKFNEKNINLLTEVRVLQSQKPFITAIIHKLLPTNYPFRYIKKFEKEKKKLQDEVASTAETSQQEINKVLNK